MNRIDGAFKEKGKDLLNIYFTAGYPNLDSTVDIIKSLEQGGADLVEIGMPFSDPVADGPTIQDSNQVALESGMSTQLLFDQLAGIRDHVSIPLLLMGYLNPVIQFGIREFCAKCAEVGIDGLILPDLPMQEYVEVYKPIFEEYGLYNIFLVTPQTSNERIRFIDNNSNGFIYMVSSASTTGAKTNVTDGQLSYFNRVRDLNLTNPTMIGFGISNHQTFQKACSFANGAIIGSAFINLLTRLKEQNRNLNEGIVEFIGSVKGTS